MKKSNQNANNATIIELLKDSPKAMQFLHDFRGFDFCKPFEIVKACGAFTLNSIKKAINKSNFDGLNIIILLKRTQLHFDGVYAAYIAEDGRIRSYTNRDLLNFNAYGRRIETAFSIGNFEEIRKKETEYIYIIYQSEEYRTPTRPQPYETHRIDTARRYKLIETRPTYYAGKTGARITSITIKDTTTNAAAVRYSFPFIPQYAPTTAQEIIDKSGYIIIDRRNSLKERAATLRAERAKAEYLRQDFSEENKRTREELTKTTRKAGELLSIATAEADFIRIKNCVDSLRWAAYYLEKHEEKTAKKEFASVEAFRRSLDSIRDDIAKAAKALEPIQPGEFHAIAAQELPAADIDHHESDLYIKFSAKSSALVARLTCKSLLTTFRSQTDGALWYELPMCYNPAIIAGNN